MKKLKDIGVVLAGIFVASALSFATDELLHLAGILPPLNQPFSDGPLALATAYRVIFTIIGAYVAARLAPDGPMEHALALGLVVLFLSVTGAVVMWNAGPAIEPHWHAIALVVTALPSAWLGGKLRMRQLSGAN